MTLFLAAMLISLTVVAAGAVGTSSPDPPVESGEEEGENQAESTDWEEVKAQTTMELSNPISPDDFQPIAQYQDCYLAENSAGKKLLYLEGDAYHRGYAEGSLCPESVYLMTHDWLKNLIFELLAEVGIVLDPGDNPILWNFVWSIMQVLACANEYAVPEEFRQEMRGMADACQDMGYDVTYQDVMTLNVGYDTLESLYAGIGALLCNEFAVFDAATTDGRLYHGRDFMFPTGGDVFSDQALVIVYKPSDGYPFVTSSAPGFVGIPTGLNTQGVSCGMDVVLSLFTRPLITGEGTLLLCRKVTQYAGSLEEGIALIRDSDRAVPWLYLIADGEEPDAAVLETMASSLLPGGDGLYQYLYNLLSGLLGIIFPGPSGDDMVDAPASIMDEEGRVISGEGELSEELMELAPDCSRPRLENGLMVRASDYLDPEWLDGLRFWYQTDPASGENWEFFPRQVEDLPDLVAMNNHYIIPLMAATYPSLGAHKQDSLWRYDTMLELLLEEHGSIDRLDAMWIIDFLNPARCDYYGTDVTQSVKGHHVLLDNRDLEMWSLHGYYDQPWVHVDLEEILAGPVSTNIPPLAEAGPDQETEVRKVVAFDAAGCSDSDGKIVSYHWDFGEGGCADIPNPTHEYVTAGEYEVTLTVIDDRGATASDSCIIKVKEDSYNGLLRLLFFFLSFLRQQ